jgi:hypothetical protein
MVKFNIYICHADKDNAISRVRGVAGYIDDRCELYNSEGITEFSYLSALNIILNIVSNNENTDDILFVAISPAVIQDLLPIRKDG